MGFVHLSSDWGTAADVTSYEEKWDLQVAWKGIKDIVRKTWDICVFPAPWQDTALAPGWHGGSGSSTLPRSGDPEWGLHPHGAAAAPCVSCPGQTPPPRAGNDPRQSPRWVANVVLVKTEVLVLSSGKRVCSAIPHITLWVIVGILLPKETSFLPCLSDLGTGS